MDRGLNDGATGSQQQQQQQQIAAQATMRKPTDDNTAGEVSNIQVVCRFRPFNEREKLLGTASSKDLFRLGQGSVKVSHTAQPSHKCPQKLVWSIG